MGEDINKKQGATKRPSTDAVFEHLFGALYFLGPDPSAVSYRTVMRLGTNPIAMPAGLYRTPQGWIIWLTWRKWSCVGNPPEESPGNDGRWLGPCVTASHFYPSGVHLVYWVWEPHGTDLVHAIEGGGDAPVY